MAENDKTYSDDGLFYYVGLKRANVPAELHVYSDGGHGFGLRRTETSASTWPDRATDWLRASGWLTPAK